MKTNDSKAVKALRRALLRKSRGVTLVEVLIVVAIIAMAILMPLIQMNQLVQ